MSQVLHVSAGVGGNLVAVQASRISTFLHMNGMPGENSEQVPRRCPSPCTTFFSPGNARGPAHLSFTLSLLQQPEPRAVGSFFLLGSRSQLSWRAKPRQEGCAFLGHPRGWAPRDRAVETVPCLWPQSVARYHLAGKGSPPPLLLLTLSLSWSQM